MSNIPKKIHYCWFGNKSLPKQAIKCIKSWKKVMPDYEIILWNEDNFNINENKYVKEAYEARKFAFVADYIRLYVLYHEGGIYMDTDVEILKPLDVFLSHEAFTGFQTTNEILTGIIGAKPNNSWIKELLSIYDNRSFIKESGSYDLTVNVTLITNISKNLGFKEGGQFHVFHNGVAIYPFDFFCAKDHITGELYITNNTYAIHHFSGSWLPLSSKLKRRVRKIVGNKIYNQMKHIIKKLKINM